MGRARRELTLADYVAIAISPVLIMTLTATAQATAIRAKT